MDYSNPTVGYYLNISAPIAAVTCVDKVAVLNTDGIWEITANGTKKLVPNSKHDAVNLACVDGKTYILAVPTGMVKVLTDGTTQKITTNTKNLKTQVKFLEKYIFYRSGNTVSIFDKNLKFILKHTYKVSQVTDFEYSNGIYYTSGFQQKKRLGVPVQIALLYRMRFDGTKLTGIPNLPEKNQGKLWSYNPADLGNDMADTRLNQLRIYGDKLYVLGSVYGGNSIFRWNGEDLSTPTLITTDKYTLAANTRSETKVYTGIVDLATFTVEKGQITFPRKDGNLGDGNSNFPKTIFVNNSSILVGSTAAYALPNRNTLTFLGKPIAPYRGDAALLATSKDLKTRIAWVTPGNGEVLLFTDKFAIIKTGNINDLPVTLRTAQNLPTNTYFVKF